MTVITVQKERRGRQTRALSTSRHLKGWGWGGGQVISKEKLLSEVRRKLGSQNPRERNVEKRRKSLVK